MSSELGETVGVEFDERVMVKEVAKAKNAHFVNRPSNRPLSKDYEEVGMWGEWEFGKWCGLMPRLTPGGDGGVDFVLPVYLTVDVKASKRGDALLVEQGKVRADIYVLAKYEEKKEWTSDKEYSMAPHTTLLGWATAQELLAISPVMSQRGIVNHSVPVEKLRTMESLKKLLSKPR